MTRPRGFIDWRPQQRTVELLEAVQTVLEEYVEQLPLTIRQIFYRLVGRGLTDKTEKGYNRQVEHIGNARRARMIDMGAIRDDGMAGELLTGWGAECLKPFHINCAILSLWWKKSRMMRFQ